MSDEPFLNPQDHLQELLAARAAGLLSAAEAQELEWLMRAFPEQLSDELEISAAAADLALGPATFEPLPTQLRSRLVAMAHQQAGAARSDQGAAPTGEAAVSLAAQTPSAGSRPELKPAGSAKPSLAWWALAASLLLALWGWWPRIAPPSGSTAADDRAALLLRHPLRASLTDPASGHPQGDVVWSESDQRGYMRLTGLKPNDPSREQYQLWIFDENQDDRYPIDGGVFSIERGSKGEVVVPIHAAIRVGKPKMFAITIEKPGGVVVSDRQRIAALGKVDG